MNSRALKARLGRIEQKQPTGDLPKSIFASCPLPDEPTEENVRRWLAEGTAHIAFNGHAIMYDGGPEAQCRTYEEWVAKHHPELQGSEQ